MPSAEPSRLTDDLWLSAYDSVGGKPRIGEWPLGVGLAAGLIAELIGGGFLELRQGELFRTGTDSRVDSALYPLLAQMVAEEEQWAASAHGPPARSRARASAARGQGEFPGGDASPGHGLGRHDSWEWPPVRSDGGLSAEARQEKRHRQRGHVLGEWIAYLAYERRAEQRVLDRLTRAGLARRHEQRRWLGGSTVRYEPFDSVTAAMPATRLRIAVQARGDLSRPELLLGGLFLATGLHHHALATLTPMESAHLSEQLSRRLDGPSRELLRAADVAVSEAAMR